MDRSELTAVPRRAYPDRGTRARRRFLRRPAFLAGLLVWTITACSDGEGAERRVEVVPIEPAAVGPGYTIELLSPERRVLTGAAASLDDLLRTIERAIAERDTARLFDLMVSEREYREILFPAFPAAHPPVSADFETIWVTHFPDAYRGLKLLVRGWGGKDVRIVAVRFEAPDQDFVNFVLHETSAVDVVMGGDTLRDMRLFGSVVEVDGRWKVLSYPDDVR